MKPVLIVHGGACSAVPDRRRLERIRKKMAAVLNASYRRLLRGGALRTVVWAVRLLEDDPEFNAGTGCRVQRDGVARLSAAVMDGSRRRFAGVLNIERIKNPVLVARALLEDEDRVLAGEGALRYARGLGMKARDVRTAAAAARRMKPDARSWDTVGACALDARGRFAAATSTGGRGRERPGRVSDCATPAGTYADSVCAVSATGVGEEIMDFGLAARIAARIADGLAAPAAFDRTFEEVRKEGKRMGAVAIDARGNVAFRTTTPLLVYAWQKGARKGMFG